MSRPDRYRDLLVERLRALLDSRGLSVLRVEKQLGRGRGYVADALRGHKKLSVEVILDVLDILDIEPEEFFGRGAPGSGEAAKLGPGRGASADAPTSRNSPLVQAVVLLLAQKGIGQEELDQIRRELDARVEGQRRPTALRSRVRNR